MKKLILIFLICSLLLLSSVGCTPDNKQNEVTTPNTTPNAVIDENTTPGDTTDAPPGETTTTPKIELTPVPDMPIPTGVLENSSDLIVNLIAFLGEYAVEHYLRDISFADKVNAIKRGAQPLHVAFDPNNYYFVCGYYNPPHDFEFPFYCCASQYTWVGYASEPEIQESYNGMECVVALQINRAFTVTNLHPNGTATPLMEHFDIYQPTFENGVNVAAPVPFDKTFIYLNNYYYTNLFEEEMIYHSQSWYYHENSTISCVCLDEDWYISFWLDTLKVGQTFNAKDALSEQSLGSELKEYYNAVISVIDTEKYRVEVNTEYVYRYGVVSFADFVHHIIE